MNEEWFEVRIKTDTYLFETPTDWCMKYAKGKWDKSLWRTDLKAENVSHWIVFSPTPVTTKFYHIYKFANINDATLFKLCFV